MMKCATLQLSEWVDRVLFMYESTSLFSPSLHCLLQLTSWIY